MKKNNLVIGVIVLLLLLLLGAGGYLMLNNNSVKTSQTTANNTLKPTQTPKTEKSLLDLIKMGQNLRCTFTSEVGNGSSQGTVYVSGQNVRADFTIKTSDGKDMQSSMIKKGDTTYIWGLTFEGKGIKMTIALDKVAENKQANQYIDPNQKVNYSCVPWNVDSTLFTTPSNIQFTDMTNFLMPKTTDTIKAPATQTSPSANTSPCNQISDPTAKAACESALQKMGN
jgi:hypothetical protein